MRATSYEGDSLFRLWPPFLYYCFSGDFSSDFFFSNCSAMDTIWKETRTSGRWIQALRRACLGALALAVLFVLPACDSSSNGGNGGNGGEGDPSVSAPSAPSGLEATPQDGTIQLGWDAVDGADTYNVYRSTSSGVDVSSSALDTGVGQSSYTDETAENGTEYFYAVSAVASEGGESAESDASGEAEVIPFAVPSGLEGTSQDSEVALSWDAAAGADTYSVYRSTSSTSGAEGEPLATGVAETSYADSTAENGTKYYYRVTSVNPGGAESEASGEVEKTPFSDPPDRP
jgi:fibronectin type 3 domain-containing protein